LWQLFWIVERRCPPTALVELMCWPIVIIYLWERRLNLKLILTHEEILSKQKKSCFFFCVRRNSFHFQNFKNFGYAMCESSIFGAHSIKQNFIIHRNKRYSLYITTANIALLCILDNIWFNLYVPYHVSFYMYLKQ
jgi:hypothetical protein